MTGIHRPGRWADEGDVFGPTQQVPVSAGVYSPNDDTDRITTDDYAHGPEYQRAKQNWEHHVAESQEKGQSGVFQLADLSPTIHNIDTPPWRGVDTFLRRAVMVAAFIILWTMIVVGVLTGAAIVKAVSGVGDPATGPAFTTGQTDDPPLCDPSGKAREFPELEPC